MGDMDQHPHSRGESRSVANHPVPSVEAEMTDQMDQEVEEARDNVLWHQQCMAEQEREDFADHVAALIEVVRRQERERIAELEAELNGTVETYTETTGDMGAEILELRTENERLREALRQACDDLQDGGRPVLEIESDVIRWRALATPPASTEDDGTQVPE